MDLKLRKLYQEALKHRIIHECGAVPYQNGELLIKLVRKHKATKILEIGTGIGYSTACLSSGNKQAYVESIDKNPIHVSLAKENCQKIGLSERVYFYPAKAEDILPTLFGNYELIFYDGHIPQKKFIAHFERLLKKGGTLVSANLFLSDPSGGRYLKLLSSSKWETKVIEDTAISIKL